MKMTKLTYLLTFAVAVTLAATGCKNHPDRRRDADKGAPTGNPSDTDINTNPYAGDTGDNTDRDGFAGHV